MYQRRKLPTVMRDMMVVFSAVVFFLVFFTTSAFAQPYTAAPYPLDDNFELVDMTYAYDPGAQTLTKTYTLKNISGQTISDPLLVNLFLWSNDISSNVWTTMAYDGIDTYANTDQSATVANNDSLVTWSSSVTPASITSASLFPLLATQTVQSGTDYPAWNIPGYVTSWPNNATASVQVQFSGVLNCNWVQNMVWIIYAQGPTLIELEDFTALPGDREVILAWETAGEIDNAGFNIYRKKRGDDELIKINAALIPAQGSAAAGAEYFFTDSAVKNGVTYQYYLEDVDLRGETTEHGPVRVTPRWIYSIFN